MAIGFTNASTLGVKLIGLSDNAGLHNSVYRGKSLGSSVTTTQWTAISNGVFTDLWTGDYWTISNIIWRIAAFDYYYQTGDTSCTAHHVVIVPDTSLYNAQMNATNITTGAYAGSVMYTTNLSTAKSTINTAFGSAHILNHRNLFSNTVTDNYETNIAWYDSTVDLMTEQNVYGGKIFHNAMQGTNYAYSHTVDKSQYPLFAHNPYLQSNRQAYWLRDVASSTYFSLVDGAGDAADAGASNSFGVRPAFSICA